jgi:hypothetical protein
MIFGVYRQIDMVNSLEVAPVPEVPKTYEQKSKEPPDPRVSYNTPDPNDDDDDRNW